MPTLMCIYYIDLQIYISDSCVYIYIHTQIQIQIYSAYNINRLCADRDSPIHGVFIAGAFWTLFGHSSRSSCESCRKASGSEIIQTKEANIDKLGGFMIIKLENSVQIYESYEPGCFFSQHLRRARGRMISCDDYRGSACECCMMKLACRSCKFHRHELILGLASG